MKSIGLLLLVLLFLAACVGPEELYDGLVENIPTVVNTNKAFTFALKADNYDFNERYSLSFAIQDSNALITTTIVVTEAQNTDSTQIIFFDEENVELLRYSIYGETVYVGIDSAKYFYPEAVQFRGENYSGEVQCVLAVE